MGFESALAVTTSTGAFEETSERTPERSAGGGAPPRGDRHWKRSPVTAEGNEEVCMESMQQMKETVPYQGPKIPPNIPIHIIPYYCRHIQCNAVATCIFSLRADLFYVRRL